MFICINNMFIMIFNPRVSVLNRNIFWPNRDDLMKIKVNEPLLLDRWMICNLSVLLISWNLVWIWVHVAGFISGVLVFFICFVCLIRIVQEFLTFCVFWVFNLFFTLVLFLGCLSGQTRIFGLVYGRTKDFGLTRSVRSKKLKYKNIKKIFSFFLHMAKNHIVI